MNRFIASRLLLLLALAHFLMDAGFAGAVVLCVGPDEHRAVESGYAAEFGCPSTVSGLPTVAEAIGSSASAPLAGDCVDRRLHSDSELVASNSSGDVPSPALAPLRAEVRPSVGQVSQAPLRARALNETAAYRAFRTTVLIV